MSDETCEVLAVPAKQTVIPMAEDAERVNKAFDGLGGGKELIVDTHDEFRRVGEPEHAESLAGVEDVCAGKPNAVAPHKAV